MKQTRHFNMLETILVDLMIGLTVGMAIPAAILVALTTPIEIAIRGIQKLLAAFSLAFRDASAVLLILSRELARTLLRRSVKIFEEIDQDDD